MQSVEFDHVSGTATEHGKRECQECGEAVYYGEPHVKVHVILEKPESPTGVNHKVAMLCDRECWGECARE